MDFALISAPLRWLAGCAVAVSLLVPAGAALTAEAVFPIGSRLGLVPLPELQPAASFAGFEDETNHVYARLIALPGNAFAEIEKTMTNDALKKQGMTVEKRETVPIAGANAILVVARQDTPAGRVRKWLLIAPIDNLTALVSLELPVPAPAPYPDAVVRATLTSLTIRAQVPAEEQLALVPFKVGDLAGLRLVRVVPGVAVQFTEGPKDGLDATEQPHLVIAVAPGGPDPRDRDQFARDAMNTLPPLKDMRITNAEPMRIGGQPGYEVRAQAKDIQTGTDIEIVQWLRFGTGAFTRILGIAPKDKWTDAFSRFRVVRDGLEPR
jgi:hypothetical protein